MAVDLGSYLSSASLTYQAAFDTVHQDLLLQWLERQFGLGGRVLQWVRLYLSGRTFRIVYGDVMSFIVYVRCSVPQGSVLVLLFFILYMSDLADQVVKYGMSLHANADNIQLYLHLCRNEITLSVDKLELCVLDIWRRHPFWSESGSPCLSHLHRLLLPSSSTPAVVGLRLVGHARLRHCDFTDWLLQRCSFQCTKDSNGQITVCVERGCVRRHRQSEVWLQSGSDTAWWTSLARRSWPSVFQGGSDCSPMSEQPRTTVPVGLLRPDRRCWFLASSEFRQPSTTCSTSLPAQHLRPSGLFSCRPHSLELSPKLHPGPDRQCRLFQTFA